MFSLAFYIGYSAVSNKLLGSLWLPILVFLYGNTPMGQSCGTIRMAMT